MEFLNRRTEIERLQRGAKATGAWLGVVSGRRRIGKTRLLTEWISGSDGVYFVADQSAAGLQREYLSSALSIRFPGFDQVRYPDWRTLFERLAADALSVGWQGPIVLDEFPYLVQADAALASIFQNWIDHGARQAKLRVVIAGSSQRMMQGLILGRGAPLYGRGNEIFTVDPLSPALIGEALGLHNPIEVVKAWSAWGGTPRYWELAQPFGRKLDDSIESLVLDPHGALHDEPIGILMEELPPATALRPILDVIGLGAHKISEIAGRLEQPATSLSRPLARLVELGLVERQGPFGASEKSGKRSLYKIADPFFRTWFRVAAPHRSFLAKAPPETRVTIWAELRDALYSEAWEDLCRMSAARLHRSLPLVGGPWLPASRYWRGNDPEFDVVTRSIDGAELLVGEVKWSETSFDRRSLERLEQELVAKGVPSIVNAPSVRVKRVLFVPRCRQGVELERAVVVTAQEVIASFAESVPGVSV